MRLIPSLVVLALLTACTQQPAGSTQHAASSTEIPADGVHIDGAFRGIYPIGNGGSCNIAMVNADQVLQFSPRARAGAALGIEIIKYRGVATYSPVGWPPYDRSAFWVGVVGGKTWRADPGVITVTSTTGGSISGTVKASDMHEVNGTTTVNALGSWTCQLLSS